MRIWKGGKLCRSYSVMQGRSGEMGVRGVELVAYEGVEKKRGLSPTQLVCAASDRVRKRERK